MKAYFNSALSHRVSRRFSQDVALHLHPRQLGPQPTDFHLLGTHFHFAVSALELALKLCLYPVEQGLVDHALCPGHCRNALPALHQSHCFLLEFERIACSLCLLRHFYSPCLY
jgi:hypothetical protein